jgi:hypothetical protein
MRSMVPAVTVALALVLPASAAFARPAYEPTGVGNGAQSVDANPSAANGEDGGGAPLPYIAVGLGGFALGAGVAGAGSARRSRRVLEA